MDSDKNELLNGAYEAAAERLKSDRLMPVQDEEGQTWLISLATLESYRVIDRACIEAERIGDNAGRLWACLDAEVGQLEHLNVGSIDTWMNESDPFDLREVMQDRGVPLEYAQAFQRGFFSGALSAWYSIKPKLLAEI